MDILAFLIGTVALVSLATSIIYDLIKLMMKKGIQYGNARIRDKKAQRSQNKGRIHPAGNGSGLNLAIPEECFGGDLSEMGARS